ncbi:MAG TPA: THUMP domain-containing protein [Gammaproteobacteria bacterium]|jgi:23S rRNA (guanine2445-N2)-methyltransferase / 23S rRNA (guanine2069-N7)-methyltransferase|nr:THUMP domain-containing protein [Gammaproteobacteria bacterium]
MPASPRHRKAPPRRGIRFFATAGKGLEPLVADELKALGAQEVKEARGGATFAGSPADAYRACLWLRTANRVLLPLARFPANDADALYKGVRQMPWEQDLSPDGTLAVDFGGTSAALTNTQFGAQKVKDAIVDRFREHTGRRPSVDRERPDLLVNCHLYREEATLSIDLSGDSLHMRGYRKQSVAAPLKENLAAALLLKCGWPKIAAQGGSFVDPLCGSGTLVIEAAMIAGDVAPGLLRDHWGFTGWLKHDRGLWEETLMQARERQNAGRNKGHGIMGYDQDAKAILAAQQNARVAGIAPAVRFEHRSLEQNILPAGLKPGLVVTNPPYGERLGQADQLGPLYKSLGDWLKSQCLHWHAGVITDSGDLGKQIGLRAGKINAFYNGALECKLLQFEVEEARYTGGALRA